MNGTIDLNGIINAMSKEQQIEFATKILDLINEVTRSNDKKL